MICGSSILARIRDFPFIFAALDVSEVPLISIVDDEELARDGIRELVESLGYKTNVFQSAEHFLRSSLLTGTTCLITDVQMPGLSGLELQEALHSLGNQTPVIVITGYPKWFFQRPRRTAQGASLVHKRGLRAGRKRLSHHGSLAARGSPEAAHQRWHRRGARNINRSAGGAALAGRLPTLASIRIGWPPFSKTCSSQRR